MPTMGENDVEALYDKLIAGWNLQTVHRAVRRGRRGIGFDG